MRANEKGKGIMNEELLEEIVVSEHESIDQEDEPRASRHEEKIRQRQSRQVEASPETEPSNCPLCHDLHD